MDTLYDLLGALPRDDAEELRTAFRRAVKGAHPDLNPGDPDAGQKFREIVRANEILTDEDQRAAYDHLLVLARKEQKQQATAAVMHKATTSAIALVTAASLGAIGYLLVLREPALADTFKHFAEVTTARPSDFAGLPRPAETKPLTVALMEAKAAAKADIAAAKDTTTAAAPSNPQLAAWQQAAANVSSDVIVPVVVTPIAITPVAATRPADPENAMASVGPPLELTPADAHTYRERGISAYRTGDLDVAMADFDRAIQLDPKFSAAYIDRGILLYRLQKFERAFADIAQAKRIEKVKNAKAAKDAAKEVAKKQKPPQAAMVVGFPPLFQRHTAKLE
jgi:tetratricopeptide (TPR) repeat protein